MPLYVSGTRPSSLPRYEGESAEEPWWKTPYGRWRLSVEIEAMRRFPDFALSVTEPGPCGERGQIEWGGQLRSSMNPDRRYLVRVTYPSRFPDGAPEVRFEDRTFPPATPHLLDGRRPCLYQPANGPRQGYDPARTTAATLIAWTALWIHAFETWLSTSLWPGREA